MDISSTSIVVYRNNRSLAGGSTVAQSGVVPHVSRVSPVKHTVERQDQEKIISGELLGKYSANNNGQTDSGIVYEQQRDSHPGFYSQHDMLVSSTQQAILLYKSNMVAEGDLEQRTSTIDYYV